MMINFRTENDYVILAQLECMIKAALWDMSILNKTRGTIHWKWSEIEVDEFKQHDGGTVSLENEEVNKESIEVATQQILSQAKLKGPERFRIVQIGFQPEGSEIIWND